MLLLVGERRAQVGLVGDEHPIGRFAEQRDHSRRQRVHSTKVEGLGAFRPRDALQLAKGDVAGNCLGEHGRPFRGEDLREWRPGSGRKRGSVEGSARIVGVGSARGLGGRTRFPRKPVSFRKPDPFSVSPLGSGFPSSSFLFAAFFPSFFELREDSSPFSGRFSLLRSLRFVSVSSPPRSALLVVVVLGLLQGVLFCHG